MQPVAVETVLFDVGGRLFRSTRSTVACSRVLAAAASSTTATTSAVFFDRSAELFGLVLDFLRTGIVTADARVEMAFVQECRFFELAPMPATDLSLRLDRWPATTVASIRAHVASHVHAAPPCCFVASTHVLTLDLDDDAPGILKALSSQHNLLWIDSAIHHDALQTCVQDVVDAFFHRHLLTLTVQQCKHVFEARAPKKLAMSVQVRCVAVLRTAL